MPAAREDDVPDRRDVVRDSLGVGLATGLYGASFGALGVASGLSVLQTCAMSVLIFTGASQFAFVGVLASGGAPLSGALTARTGFYWTGLSIFALWNLFTFLGAVAGSTMGDPRAYGLDAAVGAAFLALLWPRLHERRSFAVGGLAAMVALLLVPVTAAGVPVLAACGVALLAGVLPRSRGGGAS